MLQVYGTIYYMNRGNPFKLKALVDKWPEFNTVVVRPQEQVRCQMRAADGLICYVPPKYLAMW